jgi:hypothetical protein
VYEVSISKAAARAGAIIETSAAASAGARREAHPLAFRWP